MKKFLAIIFVIITLVSIFSACSKSDSSKTTTVLPSTQSVSKEDVHSHNDEHSHIDAKNADITDTQAIDIVKKIPKDKLKLKEDVDSYRWLVSTSGVKVNDVDCFEVNACTIDDKDEKNPIVNTIAVYFVSFDGKKVMMKDSKTSKIIDIK